MIFGDQSTFAVQAVLEPGASTLASNIVGRIRLFVGGTVVGNFDEPSCVLRGVSEHLTTLASCVGSLWHPSLAGVSASEQFATLNRALFLDSDADPPDEYHLLNFLTNVSEAFDHVKAFLISPGDGSVHALIELQDSEIFLHQPIPLRTFSTVSAQLATWIQENERGIRDASA